MFYQIPGKHKKVKDNLNLNISISERTRLRYLQSLVNYDRWMVVGGWYSAIQNRKQEIVKCITVLRVGMAQSFMISSLL